MGHGIKINGRYQPITPWAGSWAATVNDKKPAVKMPHPVDVRGNPLPPRPRAPGSWT